MSETMEMERITVDGVEKFAMNFPLTDENGQPILDRHGKPRFTHVVGDTEAEVAKKIAQANVEIARTLERANRHIETLKNKKPTPRATPTDMKGTPLTPEEKVQVGLDTQDPRKAADAIERVVRSVAPVEKIAGEVERQGKTLDIEARKRIAREFITAHAADYYPIEANNALLNQYLNANGLEFSVDNLEIALAANQEKLATKPAPHPAPGNEPPRNDAPGNEPPNPGAPPSQQRRAPVGGIRESQVSGRPSGEPVLTRAQALEMLYKEPRKYEEWMRDPKKCAILNQALAGR